MKIKVSCIGIVDYGTRPEAVIAADIRIPKSQPVRYVLMSDTLRAALSDLARAVDREWGYYGNIRPTDGSPLLYASHAWDARGQINDGLPLGQRTERWGNASHAWVRAAAIAPYVLNDLRTWCEQNHRAGYIAAPSWNALVAAQIIALGAGLAPPTATVDAGQPAGGVSS